MFDLLRSQIFGREETGLPPSLLRPNSGLGDSPYSEPGSLPSQLSAAAIEENLNAAPWARRFECNFIEPGLVLYRGGKGREDEMVLLEPEVLERMAPSFVGKPVIDWDHAEVWPEIIGDGEADGVVSRVWKGADGWWHCEFMIWTKTAVEHCLAGDWFVSCAWAPLEEDKTGGRYHSIDFTHRVLDAQYTHLALVKNPRYENARIRANSTGEGYKMAWGLFDRKKPQTLRLNAADGADAEKAHLNVDGQAVEMDKLCALADEERKAKANADLESKVLDAADDDVVERNGRKYTAGELRNAHRNAMRRNADLEKENNRKSSADRRNDLQLKGAGSEKSGALAGAGGDRIDGVDDNPDAAAEAAKKLSAAAERINSLEKELAELKGNRSDELRTAAERRNSAELRLGPVGGAPDDQGFITMEDRIRRGNADLSLSSGR